MFFRGEECDLTLHATAQKDVTLSKRYNIK